MFSILKTDVSLESLGDPLPPVSRFHIAHGVWGFATLSLINQRSPVDDAFVG